LDELSGPVWTHWHGHVEVIVGLAVLQGAYLLGVGPVRERYGLADDVNPRQVATFTAGVLVILFSLVSPIHVLSDRYLFNVHMLQHILLTLVAPPLLILGTPDWLLRLLLRPNWAFRLARLATYPVIAFAVFNIVFAVWHIPALYDTSVTSHQVHIGEHLMFMVTAVLMWWPITSVMPELPRLSYPMQMGYLFLLSVAQIIVFAIILFAKEPLYEFYVDAPRISSLSPIVDQQIGAIIMKIGGGLIFLTLFVIIFFRWFGQENQRSQTEASELEQPNLYPPRGRELEDTLR
jgi:putative membrane protein